CASYARLHFLLPSFFSSIPRPPRPTLFPSRRSSDLVEGTLAEGRDAIDALAAGFPAGTVSGAPKVRAMEIIDELEKDKRGLYAGDRKSTRLNSSHRTISYAVFCLKKKKNGCSEQR